MPAEWFVYIHNEVVKPLNLAIEDTLIFTVAVLYPIKGLSIMKWLLRFWEVQVFCLYHAY